MIYPSILLFGDVALIRSGKDMSYEKVKISKELVREMDGFLEQTLNIMPFQSLAYDRREK
jgi:hypothetical protein